MIYPWVTTSTNRLLRRPRSSTIWQTCLAVLFVPVVVNAGSVRVWPSAVVTTAEVHLGDICELTGFDAEQAADLETIVVSASPEPAGLKLVYLDLVRTVLHDHNINLATITLGGAMQCSVTRPSVPAGEPLSDRGRRGVQGKNRADVTAASSTSGTLADAVTKYFRLELRHYDGAVEVIFGRTDQQLLSLSEPEFRFVVRKRTGPPLGLISLTVDVIKAEQIVQTIPMAVQVQLRRKMLITRKAVNQGATIAPRDVELVTTIATRVDRKLINEPATVIGQRAKRFIAAGLPLLPNMIESVPLVKRGQLVTLTSVNNNISIVTTAKATEDGLLGDVILVTTTDNRKKHFSGEVVGVGHVRMGSPVNVSSNTGVALGGRS